MIVNFPLEDDCHDDSGILSGGDGLPVLLLELHRVVELGERDGVVGRHLHNKHLVTGEYQ